jgi:hypothetical protein
MDAVSAQAPTMPTAAIRVDRSLLDRARQNDLEAISRMFRQFMSPDEEIYFAEYCGLLGFWIFGTHSFACLSNRRLASLQVGAFGRVLYNDGFLEHHNSGIVAQPSLLKLYVWAFFALLFGVLVLGMALTGSVDVFEALGSGLLGGLAGVLVVALGIGLALLTIFVVARVYYALNKCGLVWWIREGVSVYVFTNRGKMNRANHLYRLSCQVRDERLKAVGHP